MPTIETLAETGVIVRPQIEDEPDPDALGGTRVTKVYVFSDEQGKRDSIIGARESLLGSHTLRDSFSSWGGGGVV